MALPKLWWVGEKYHQNSKPQKYLADLLIAQYSFRGDERVLDVGCGDGKISEELFRKVPQGSVLGLDPSESMLSFAKAHYEQSSLQFVLGTASELSFSSEFDLITSFSTLHWEPRQKEALCCFRKALKPGGRILLALSDLPSDLINALQTVCTTPEWKPFFVDFQPPGKVWSANDYAYLLLETGFVIQKLELVKRLCPISSFEEYRGVLDGMLPHPSFVPNASQDLFLDAVIAELERDGERDLHQNPILSLNVLEVIARKPL